MLITHALKRNKSIIEVDFSSCNLTPNGMKRVIRALRKSESIVSLRLSNKDGIYWNKINKQAIESFEFLFLD